jgi:hypothetical protein
VSDEREEFTMEDRRRIDAVATATAIESVRGDIKALSVELKGFTAVINHQVEQLQRDQKVDRLNAREIEVEVAKGIADLKVEMVNQINEHKHDVVPHPDTLGGRVNSLESSRTYMKGMIAVGALVMPTVTGLIFKWLGAT